MRKANYWNAVFISGLFPSLYIATGAALVLTTAFHTSAVFHITFVLLMILAVPCSMWLYHAVILPRRKRCKQGIPR